MNQTEVPAKLTFQNRFLIRVLEHLMKNIDAGGLLLKQNDAEIYRVGKCEGNADESFEFEGFILFLYKEVLPITTKDRSFIKSARELIALTLPSIRRITKTSGTDKEEILSRAAGLPLNTWVDSLLGLLNTLSLRSDLLKYYENILQLNEKILLAHDLNAVLQIITDTAKEVVNAEAASLLLVDHETGEMFFNVISGNNKSELKEIRIPKGKGIAGDVALKGEAELIHDVASDKRVFQDVDDRLQNKTRNMIAVPIMARNSVVGVFEVINASGGGFREEDKEFLSNIGLHTGLLLENARSKEDLIKTNRELDKKISELNTLFETGKSLKSSLDLEELKEEFLRTIMRMMKVKSACLMEISPDKKQLTGILSFEMTPHGLENIEHPMEYEGITDIVSWMSDNREPFFFDQKAEGDEGSGLLRRFRTENPDLFKSDNAPSVWIPIFSGDTREIMLVLSLSGFVSMRTKHIHNMAFFGNLMDQAQMAFHNAATYWEAVRAKNKEENIRQTFQKYVPSRVVEEILEQSENPVPKKQTATVLFLDIRNFTGISEQMDPSLLVDLLNEFYEEMVEAVSMYDGIVDKFMGDAIMALFGVPETTDHDADNALNAALEITHKLKILNEKRKTEGKVCFEIGIGIHTGPVIAGNIGSKRRMDYTVIGDTVNLASRLEKEANRYNTTFIFTEETIQSLRDRFPVREIDLIQVRGRTGANRWRKTST